MSRAELEHVLARGPEGKKSRLMNNKLRLSAALHRAIHNSISQNGLAGYLRHCRFLAGVGYIYTLQMYPTQAKLEWATLKASFSAACEAPAVLEIAHSLSKRQLPRQLDILEGFGDQCSRLVGRCGQRSSAGRLPRGAAIFPLVIGELLYVGTVVAHDEDLAVGLRRAGVDRFVLKAHARAAEEQLLSVGGPSEMRLVTTRMSELCQTVPSGWMVITSKSPSILRMKAIRLVCADHTGKLSYSVVSFLTEPSPRFIRRSPSSSGPAVR
jgi:hypothetical protein